MSSGDVRDRESLEHEDIAGLNFVRRQCPYVFRRHFRQGLRSHVMEVLTPEGLEAERSGIVAGGFRRFPDAQPLKMLRIFRSRFSNSSQALEEIRRLRIVERYLPPDLLARSEEFLVTYWNEDGDHLLLCGLQEYVSGEILDPWSLPVSFPEAVKGPLARHAARFTAGVKQMVLEGGYIPDLAGIGNLFATPEGRIKLVDINNISRIREGDGICLDDRGYPACDKSIEALARIEQHLCGAGPRVTDEPPYNEVFRAERMREVRKIEKRFYEGLKRQAGKMPQMRKDA